MDRDAGDAHIGAAAQGDRLRAPADRAVHADRARTDDRHALEVSAHEHGVREVRGLDVGVGLPRQAFLPVERRVVAVGEQGGVVRDLERDARPQVQRTDDERARRHNDVATGVDHALQPLGGLHRRLAHEAAIPPPRSTSPS